MKTYLQVLVGGALSVMVTLSSLSPDHTLPLNNSNDFDKYNESGLDFTLNHAKVNTKYSDFGSAVFKNKLIIVSSKKIGAIGNGINKLTNEPYTDLFCLDFDKKGSVSYPLLFSRILNTKNNEGSVSFSPDESTIYYTRSSRKTPHIYQLYKAELEANSHGNWINHVQLTKNNSYSVENPFVSRDGKKLYFSSNRKDGYGGYDLYVADINKKGTIGTPKNLGPLINSEGDEKYPHYSLDGKYLFFASNGHDGLGGFDIFVSKPVFGIYKSPRNLGQTVNSDSDELAFMFMDNNKGVFSSNKADGLGSYDLYEFDAKPIYRDLEGVVLNENDAPLSNTTLILLDEEGNEIARQKTDKTASYKFKVRAFESYIIKAVKQGYADKELKLAINDSQRLVFSENLKLASADDSAVVKK
ncbi:hypothetical protein [Winogradskyella sp. 3972H.M.0a.05]|uniref:TolB family protein n=1 Tax=Winogradskyella sp. 3972H.M.0a.05 TaxID=2950277 RepID=UPI00339A7658